MGALPGVLMLVLRLLACCVRAKSLKMRDDRSEVALVHESTREGSD